MPIEITPVQNPVQTPNTPQLQQWGFNPTAIVSDYYQGGAIPAPVTVAVTFKDVLSTAQANPYTGLTYQSYLTFTNQSEPPFIAMAGALVTGVGIYVGYSNGLSGNIVFTFQNLALLSPGMRYANAVFEIWGFNSNGINMLIEKKAYPMKVMVHGSNVPVLSETELEFAWTLGTETPLVGQEFTIDAPSWSIQSPLGFYFLQVEGATLLQPTSWGGAFITGSGLKTLQLVMMPEAEPEEITENPQTLYLDVNANAVSLPIVVTYLNENGLFLQHDSLSFVAYKSIQDAEAQTVAVHYPEAYTISCPPWMTVSPASGTGSKTLTFEPISANNMDQGVYQGEAVITLSSTGAVLGVISLTYEVVATVLSPYPEGEIAFTLDRLFLQFLNTTPEAYFHVQVNARLFDFYALTYRDESLNFKVPLFRGRQTLNIGQPLDRMMARISDLTQHSAFGYNPAQVNLVVTEHAGDTQQVYNFGPINFVAGLKPQISYGSGFLDINPGARRVTPNSWQLVNMLVGSLATLSVYKNNVQVASFMTFRQIFTYKMDFAVLGAAQGDVFEFRIERPEHHASISKTFKVFPEGYNSNTIVWENEYKLRSVLECTGKYQVNSELENRTQELELQLRSVLDKLESTKTVKLTLNTGWLLKTDMPSVESLMRAKRAVLMLDGKNISLVPVAEKITNVDDDRALISFDLEFRINREYNEEIYSF